MKPINPASEFEQFFARYQNLVGTVSNQKVDQKLDWNQELAGLKKIFSSFDSFVSVKTPEDGTVVIEWNPLNQQHLFNQLTKEKMALTYSFSETFETIGEFITSAHEAMHVLLLEAFFCGRYNFKNAAKLQELYLMFEGFSFWYSDIVLTPKLRVRMPFNEILYKNSAVSSRLFHPSQALVAAGVKNQDQALDLYLDAFRGKMTALYKSDDIFALNLQQRVGQFYSENLQPLKTMFQTFKQAGIFSEFFKRFTKGPGIPTLLSEETLNIDLDSAPEKYVKNLYGIDLVKIESMPEAEIKAVRLRRKIQTRAYYAFCLLSILKNGDYQFFSKKPKLKLIEDLEIYISKLEKQLHTNLILRQLDTCEAEVKKADAFYGKNIRAVFTLGNAWVTKRQSLLKMTWHNSKVTYFQPAKSSKDIDKHIESILWAITESVRLNGNLMKRLLKPLSLIQQAKNTKSKAQKMKLYNQVLMLPEVLPIWSVRLDSFNPAQNQFRELLFSYE